MVLEIRILASNTVISSTKANEIILPTSTGQIGVLEGHARLITALDTGLLRMKLNGTWTPMILYGGVAQIDRNKVTVISTYIEEIIDFDLSEAKKNVAAARLALETAETSKARLDASMELKKASARLEAMNLLAPSQRKKEEKLNIESQ